MSSLTDIPLSNIKKDRFSRFGWKGKKQQKFQLELDDIADSPPRKEKKKDIMSTDDDVQPPWYLQTQSIEHAIQYTVGQQDVDASSSSISIPDTSRKHLDGLVIFPPPSLSKTSRRVSDIESARSTAGGRSEGFMTYMLEGNSRKKKLMITSVIVVMIICIIAITVAALTSTQNDTGDADAVLPAYQVEQPKEDGTSSPIIDIDVTEDDNIRVNSTLHDEESSEALFSTAENTGDTADAIITDATIITDLSSSSEATTVSTTTISSTRPQTTTATSTRPQTNTTSSQPQTTTTTTKSTTSSTSTTKPANPDWLSELASTSNPSTSPSVSPTQKSTTTAPSSSPSSTATQHPTSAPSTSTPTPLPACIAKCDQDADDKFKKDLDKVVDKCMEKANCIKDDKNCEKDCEKDSEKKREDLLEKAVAKALECKQTCQSNILGGESGVIVHQQIKPRRSSPSEIELELLFP